MVVSSPLLAADLPVVRSAVRLLIDAGYLDDADRLLAGDPALLEQIQDTDFLEWLAIGAPGGGASSEIVTLTLKGVEYEAG